MDIRGMIVNWHNEMHKTPALAFAKLRFYQKVLAVAAMCLVLGVLLFVGAALGFCYAVAHMMDDPTCHFQNGIIMSNGGSSMGIQIHDKNGEFLVDGNIDRISYETGSWRNVVIMAYYPNEFYWKRHPEDSPSATVKTRVARLDLRTLEVKHLPDTDGATAKTLQPASDWF
ncbi:MAG: hypothetical protein ACAI35_28255 [Candidatus Methylacidiphilales bacterium]|nr:hypothetical protein [Candidatus Methylacidiphilales bacterium]